MSSRAQRDKGQKQNTAQTILTELLKEEENKYCADCKAKGMEPSIDREFACQAVKFSLPGRQITVFFYYRTSLGVLEPRSVSLHSMRGYTSKLRCSYFSSQVSKP